MEITATQVDARVPVTILKPQGAVDASNYQDLIDAAEVVYDGGVQHILLDLSEVSHLSSSGIVALHSIVLLLQQGKAPDREAGWDALYEVDGARDGGPQPYLKLLSPTPKVDKVLEMVGFKQYIEVYTDQGLALGSFK